MTEEVNFVLSGGVWAVNLVMGIELGRSDPHSDLLLSLKNVEAIPSTVCGRPRNLEITLLFWNLDLFANFAFVIFISCF